MGCCSPDLAAGIAFSLAPGGGREGVPQPYGKAGTVPGTPGARLTWGRGQLGSGGTGPFASPPRLRPHGGPRPGRGRPSSGAARGAGGGPAGGELPGPAGLRAGQAGAPPGTGRSEAPRCPPGAAEEGGYGRTARGGGRRGLEGRGGDERGGGGRPRRAALRRAGRRPGSGGGAHEQAGGDGAALVLEKAAVERGERRAGPVPQQVGTARGAAPRRRPLRPRHRASAPLPPARAPPGGGEAARAFRCSAPPAAREALPPPPPPAPLPAGRGGDLASQWFNANGTGRVHWTEWDSRAGAAPQRDAQDEGTLPPSRG